MRRLFGMVMVLVGAFLATTPLNAADLLTVTCGTLKGSSQMYGASISDHFDAKAAKRPDPPPTLERIPDSKSMTEPSFVIDLKKDKATVTWPGATSLNSPLTFELIVVDSINSANMITAVGGHPGFTYEVYSFFPKFGTLFYSKQYLFGTGYTTVQDAFFGKCNFSTITAP
jgi:hypothetical protein